MHVYILRVSYQAITAAWEWGSLRFIKTKTAHCRLESSFSRQTTKRLVALSLTECKKVFFLQRPITLNSKFNPNSSNQSTFTLCINKPTLYPFQITYCSVSKLVVTNQWRFSSLVALQDFPKWPSILTLAMAWGIKLLGGRIYIWKLNYTYIDVNYVV